MSSRISDEQFSNPPAADVKNHGLFNQGATCYLNSVLQVLFMTKDFREAVERHTCENSSNPCTEHMDCHLKHLFSDLQKGTASTNEITDKLGIHRVNEQRDAAEYFERILALTSPDASQIFHGELTHKTICSTCHKEENTDGLFWLLPLELVDSYSEHYSVVDGTEEYFRASYFTGENQMYCNHCDFKCDAATKCVVKRYPEVLVLLLKRFKFDFSHMTYVKNSSAVAVPCTLQIPENQMYDLYATVEHVGYLRGGHYTATIKSQEDERWYHFSDTRVTLLDYLPFQMGCAEKSQSVYLLFYRKKTNYGLQSSKSGADQLASQRGKFQDNKRVANRRRNMSEDDSGRKQGCRSWSYEPRDQQMKKKRDIKGDNGRKRCNDGHEHERRISERHFGQDKEDQGNGEFANVRQNRPEHSIRYKNIGAEKQAKEKKDKGDGPLIKTRQDSSLRQAGSAGMERLRENQGVSSAVEMTLVNSQPKAGARFKEFAVQGVRECQRSSGKKEAQVRRLSKNHREKKRKQSTGCFQIFQKKRKNSDQDSESE